MRYPQAAAYRRGYKTAIKHAAIVNQIASALNKEPQNLRSLNGEDLLKLIRDNPKSFPRDITTLVYSILNVLVRGLITGTTAMGIRKLNGLQMAAIIAKMQTVSPPDIAQTLNRMFDKESRKPFIDPPEPSLLESLFTAATLNGRVVSLGSWDFKFTSDNEINEFVVKPRLISFQDMLKRRGYTIRDVGIGRRMGKVVIEFGVVPLS